MTRWIACIAICGLSWVSNGQESSQEIIIPEDVKVKLDSLQRLESVYWAAGNHIENLYVRHEILAKYSTYLTIEQKATWHTKAGESYYNLGSYLLAIELLNKSLSYNSSELKPYTYARLGSSYIQLGKLDSAIVNYQRAIDLSFNDVGRMPHLNSLGYVYYLNGDYVNSERMYREALALFSEVPEIDSVQFGIVQSNFASLDLAHGNISSAIEILLDIESSAYYLKHGDWFHREINLKLANCYLELGNCLKAREYAGKLEDSYMIEGESDWTLQYLELMVGVASECGSKEELIRITDEYISVKNKKDEESSLRLLIVEKLQRDAFEEQLNLTAENLELIKESEDLLTLSNSRLRRIFWISGFGLLIVLVFVVAWYNQKRSKQERKESFLLLKSELIAEQEMSSELKIQMAEQELENKKLELGQILNSIDKNSSLFEEIVSRLTQLNDKEGDVKEDLSQLLHFIRQHSKSDEMQELIDSNSEVLGAGFKVKVEKQFPDLTGSELQMMIFIRLGLSTKEMAQLKNVEPSSIRIFKHRLKTKMDLNKEEDLAAFIQRI
ncbi:MAG: hypothetical protein QNK23_17470 [Crocinitomicaceae bacterium]|nr:hypothetical protein [Crocinitomicaceae bacterium]